MFPPLPPYTDQALLTNDTDKEQISDGITAVQRVRPITTGFYYSIRVAV